MLFTNLKTSKIAGCLNCSFKSIVVFLLMVSFSSFSIGQTKSTSSGSWSDRATWNTNKVPQPNDNVIIRHDVTFNGSKGSGKISNISFSNSGSGNPKFTIVTGTNLEVRGNFDAANGTIVINGGLKLTGNNSELKNFRNGDFSGPVTFPGSNSDSLVYPLDNSGGKGAIALGNVPSGKSFTVSKNETNPKTSKGSTISPNLSDISSAEYFEISPNTTLNQEVRVTLFWNSGSGTDFSQIVSKGNLRVAHFSGSKWENYGNTGTGGSLAGDGYVTSPPTNNFSPFTFGSKSGGGALPVEIVYFNVSEDKEEVTLNWKTATETNNSHFLIQRRSPDGDFKNIGKKRGFGTSYEPKTYTFQDDMASSGTYYYRLKQVDHDGSFEYSEIKALQVKSSIQNLQLAIVKVYPNPILNQISLKLKGVKGQTGRLQIRSLAGNVKMQKQFSLVDGGNQLNWSGLGNLSSGIYLLTLEADQSIVTKRIIKQ